MLRRISTPLVLLLVIGFAGGCDLIGTGDDGEDILTTLAGSWSAVQFTFTNNASPTQSLNMIEEGWGMTLTIGEDGSYSGVIIEPGSSESETGTIAVEGNLMTISYPEGLPDVFAFELVNHNRFSLISETQAFDFDDDGNDDPATVTIVFERVVEEGALTDLAGSWAAAQFIYINKADPTQLEDAILAGGFFGMEIEPSMEFVVAMSFPGDEDGAELDMGTISAVGDSIRIDIFEDDEDKMAAWSIAGDILTMDVGDDHWDFDDDGMDEAATLHIVLHRFTPITTEQLYGAWTATESVFINAENPTQAYDASDDIVAMTFQANATGGLAVWHLAEGDSTEVEEGSYEIVSNLMVVNMFDEEGLMALQYALAGDQLLMINNNDRFDFDDDGLDEPALQDLTFERPPVIESADVAGAWVASSMVLRNPDDPLDAEDVLAAGGTFTLVTEGVHESPFEMVSTHPGEEFENDHGGLHVIGNILTVWSESESKPDYLKIEVSPGQIDLVKPDDHSDWDDDGFDDLAVMEMTLVPTTPALIADFTGTWNATSMVYTEVGNPTNTEDFIIGGGAFSITITEVGGYTTTTTEVDALPVEEGGELEIIGNAFIAVNSVTMEAGAFTYVFAGATTVTVTENDNNWDFGSGEVPAVMVVTLVKQ
jgi:hypothetical protein